MTGPVRIGLIGCGANMAGHAGRLLANPEVEIVGLADPFPQSIARLRERHPALEAIPDFADYPEMLAALEPDAVEISTPHSMHYEQILTSLAANCHVLCEKPLVLRASHARDVIRASEEVRKVLLVSYQRHYWPIFRFMRETIQSGTIGEIRFVQALQNQNWYRNQKAANRWRIHPELSGGGQLNDSGSHLVDILLHVTGLSVESVYCLQERFDLDVDVNSSLSLRFTNGALGSWAVVGDAPCVRLSVWEDITIYGSEGALYYRMLGDSQSKEAKLELRLIDGDQALEIGPLPARSDPDTNFVNAILGRAGVEAPPVCGLRVAELTEAAWHSARLGQAVKVAELPELVPA